MATRPTYIPFAPAGFRLAISELDGVTSLEDSDLLLASREETPHKVFASQLLTYLSDSDGKLTITLGAPDNSKGQNGEYALDPSSGMIYGPKVNNIWPTGTPLTAFQISDAYSPLPDGFEGGELFHVEQSGTTYLATIDDVKNYVESVMPTSNNNVNGGNF